MLHSYNAGRREDAGRWAGLRKTGFVVALLAASLAACDSEKILEVTDPDVATPESLEGSAALGVVHAGAIGDFQLGYAGSSGSEGMVQMTALFADEYVNSETFPTRIEVDQRNIQEDNSTMTAIMRNIQRARASADFASNKFMQSAATDIRRSETMSLAGFAIVSMGEAYCSGVPISRLTDAGDIEFGEPRTTAQLWDDAIAKFDSALVQAGASTAAAPTRARNLARIGKGRALLNKGDYTGAAAAVAGVPTSYVYFIFHSDNTGRQTNSLYEFQRVGSRFSVADQEGINGLPFRSESDARTPWSDPDRNGFDNVTPMFYQEKYPTRSAPVPLAEGVEARLIEAEAALSTGNLVGYAAGVNAAREQAGISTPIVVPVTTAEQVDQLFRERAFSLWFTGHRMGDLRRLVRQYGRAQNTVFPTGNYFKGGTYGTDVNFIIPTDEKNNPNFSGCLDRSA